MRVWRNSLRISEGRAEAGRPDLRKGAHTGLETLDMIPDGLANKLISPQRFCHPTC